MKNAKGYSFFVIVAIIVFAAIMINGFWDSTSQEKYTYTDFQKEVKKIK